MHEHSLPGINIYMPLFIKPKAISFGNAPYIFIVQICAGSEMLGGLIMAKRYI